MKTLLRLSLLVALVATSSLAASEKVPVQLVGDETLATRIKASPREYWGKPVVMTGYIEVSSLYIAKYLDAEETHFSLAFRQVLSDPPQVMGERVTVFLRRGEETNKIVDRIITQSNPPGSMTRMRIKATIDPERYETGSWDLLELIDVQFPRADLRGWGPWILQAEKDLAKSR